MSTVRYHTSHFCYDALIFPKIQLVITTDAKLQKLATVYLTGAFSEQVPQWSSEFHIDCELATETWTSLEEQVVFLYAT